MREELPKNWGQEDGSFIDDGGAAGHRQIWKWTKFIIAAVGIRL
jgi:hypothetical protein